MDNTRRYGFLELESFGPQGAYYRIQDSWLLRFKRRVKLASCGRWQSPFSETSYISCLVPRTFAVNAGKIIGQLIRTHAVMPPPVKRHPPLRMTEFHFPWRISGQTHMHQATLQLQDPMVWDHSHQCSGRSVGGGDDGAH